MQKGTWWCVGPGRCFERVKGVLAQGSDWADQEPSQQALILIARMVPPNWLHHVSHPGVLPQKRTHPSWTMRA